MAQEPQSSRSPSSSPLPSPSPAAAIANTERTVFNKGWAFVSVGQILHRQIPLAELRRLHQQHHLLQCFQLSIYPVMKHMCDLSSDETLACEVLLTSNNTTSQRSLEESLISNNTTSQRSLEELLISNKTTTSQRTLEELLISITTSQRSLEDLLVSITTLLLKDLSRNYASLTTL